jgi:hypothetical protein
LPPSFKNKLSPNIPWFYAIKILHAPIT